MGIIFALAGGGLIVNSSKKEKTDEAVEKVYNAWKPGFVKSMQRMQILEKLIGWALLVFSIFTILSMINFFMKGKMF
ncbi:MAG: hypothetical protein V1874_00260 [Spirochaetota bacterium]